MFGQRQRIRVGVIGMYQSGKTVLLTALINHLLNYDPNSLRIGSGMTGLAVMNDDLAIDQGVDKFPYKHCRSRLGNGEWPTKTFACSQYRCQVALTPSSNDKPRRGKQIDLTLTDMAGERLADLSMAAMDYPRWSDTVLELLDTQEYRQHAREYLDVLERPNVPVDQILSSYRRVLAELILHFLPFVSPSTFLLDQHGKYVEERTADSLVDKRFCGLDAARQFAPLPKSVRERTSEIATEFSVRYAEYRSQVVMPLVHCYKGCDTLLVLADLTMLLQGGVGMYNGHKEMLSTALDYLAPGTGRLNRVIDGVVGTLTWGRKNANDILVRASRGRLRLPRVRRLAFVATKADKVHQADRDKLKDLLSDLTRGLAKRGRHLGGLNVKEFVCAAVNSTKSLDEYPGLKCLQASRNGDPGHSLLTPSPVPKNWPDDWGTDEFKFPNVLPWMPAIRDRPPPQFGLDGLLTFIFDGS